MTIDIVDTLKLAHEKKKRTVVMDTRAIGSAEKSDATGKVSAEAQNIPASARFMA